MISWTKQNFFHLRFLGPNMIFTASLLTEGIEHVLCVLRCFISDIRKTMSRILPIPLTIEVEKANIQYFLLVRVDW